MGPLSGATTPGQSGPGDDGNEGVLCIPQSSSITGTSPSDCLVSYPGHTLGGGSYPFAEVQFLYSTAQPTGQPMKSTLTISMMSHPASSLSKTKVLSAIDSDQFGESKRHIIGDIFYCLSKVKLLVVVSLEYKSTGSKWCPDTPRTVHYNLLSIIILE